MLIDSLACFDKYEPPVKERLARVVRYESHAINTVLLRQGDVGLAFYYIVSGRVVVSITQGPHALPQVRFSANSVFSVTYELLWADFTLNGHARKLWRVGAHQKRKRAHGNHHRE
jgi:hypothetical protein